MPTEKYRGKFFSQGRAKQMRSSSSRAKSFVYIKGTVEENMNGLFKCLSRSLSADVCPAVLPSKGTRFTGRLHSFWKEAHHSLPIKEHHLTH